MNVIQAYVVCKPTPGYHAFTFASPSHAHTNPHTRTHARTHVRARTHFRWNTLVCCLSHYIKTCFLCQIDPLLMPLAPLQDPKNLLRKSRRCNCTPPPPRLPSVRHGTSNNIHIVALNAATLQFIHQSVGS